MSEPPNENQMARLLIGLTEGQLSNIQLQELCDLVQGDADCRADYIDYVTMHAMLEFRHGRIEAYSESTETESHLLDSFDAQIQFAEASGESFPEPFKFEPRTQRRNPQHRAGHAFSLLGYVASKAIRKHAVTLSGVAAVLVLAVVLVFIFKGTGDDPVELEVVINEPPIVFSELLSEPKADEPVEPPKPSDPVVVATLTAEHHALWAESALAPGSPLRAGQRFSLTEGFAEVTTARGAVVLLEAPATIELTDNDNAIRLHLGKLVGICETESSKGLLVRTPHMDITDIGTRFGVWVKPDISLTHVIEGEVQASITNAVPADRPMRLTAQQTASVDATAQQVTAADPPSRHFVADWSCIASTPVLEGDIRYEPSPPTNLSNRRSEDEMIRLFPERRRVRLDQPITATFIQPGEYMKFPAIGAVLPAGAQVDAYLIHFDQPGHDHGTLVTSRATITFDRPVVAVMANSIHLDQTQTLFALPGTIVSENQPPGRRTRGVEGADNLDFVSLSDDRTTVTVVLNVDGLMDQVRILVEAEPTKANHHP